MGTRRFANTRTPRRHQETKSHRGRTTAGDDSGMHPGRNRHRREAGKVGGERGLVLSTRHSAQQQRSAHPAKGAGLMKPTQPAKGQPGIPHTNRHSPHQPKCTSLRASRRQRSNPRRSRARAGRVHASHDRASLTLHEVDTQPQQFQATSRLGVRRHSTHSRVRNALTR